MCHLRLELSAAFYLKRRWFLFRTKDLDFDGEDVPSKTTWKTNAKAWLTMAIMFKSPRWALTVCRCEERKELAKAQGGQTASWRESLGSFITVTGRPSSLKHLSRTNHHQHPVWFRKCCVFGSNCLVRVVQRVKHLQTWSNVQITMVFSASNQVTANSIGHQESWPKVSWGREKYWPQRARNCCKRYWILRASKRRADHEFSDLY